MVEGRPIVLRRKCGPVNLVLAIYDWCKYSRRLRRTSMLTTGIRLSKTIISQILHENRKMMYFSIIHFESHTSFRLVSKLVTLNDLERLNDRRHASSLRLLIFFSFGLHNLAENCSWARDVNGRDQDETETRRWYVSRLSGGRDHNPAPSCVFEAGL